MENKKIKLTDLARYKFVIDPRYYFCGWAKSPKILGRQATVRALVKARSYLPRGYNFKIWDGQRPYEVQLAMMSSIRRRIRLTHPGLSKKECEKMVLKFGGSVTKRMKRPDTHQNGGSFDLTLVDNRGNEMYMGTDHDDLTEKAATDYFEKKMKLSLFEKEAKKNRRLLKRIMEKAEFINYAPEWWHWSYEK